MKAYEKKSILINFFVYFSLLEILLVLLFLEIYKTKQRDLKEDIFKSMQLCSYSLECPKYNLKFVQKKDLNTNQLYQNKTLYTLFSIPNSKKFYLKIEYPQKSYLKDIKDIQKKYLFKFLMISLLLFLIALFFTFYSLKPIRDALSLNEEFVNDILHDFNTPISSMKLNIHMFKDEYKENNFVKKLENSLETILLLQNNLKSFLKDLSPQYHIVDIALLAQKRVKIIKELYPNIEFIFQKENELKKLSNKDLLIRVFDNILINSAKYNKKDGFVSIRVQKDRVIIKDSGKGIKDPKHVFNRYYKEQMRGLGLGLHIVKKICDELNIGISLSSKIGVETVVVLDFSNAKGDKDA